MSGETISSRANEVPVATENGSAFAFGLVTVVGIADTAYLVVFGRELDSYA
ncbi:hypothetical protein [Haladaptatus caseinilyticus]|uniref:hypothetical protein n=1 Tax=Haladaptatus caseinilyticus TaxID=2993314 RepID=UPI00224B0274|nr:hypothetical protein [Haladaptatus caseinilyticus]